MQNREGFSKADQELMLLSRETRQGLRITGACMQYIPTTAMLTKFYGLHGFGLTCMHT